MTDHPHRIAARLSHSPKLAARECGYALTVDQIRAIRDLQFARAERRAWVDPCIRARTSRRYRTRSAVAAREAADAARAAARRAEADRERAAAEQARAVRESLIAAARQARRLGFSVRSSQGRAGRISSYYASRHDPARGRSIAIRISDHELPWTPRRDFMAREHGRDGFDGFHGAELIVDRPRRAEWLRRALILTAAGRM